MKSSSGIKIHSDALLAFLKGRNANARVLEAIGTIPLPRQIALPDGILFSEREIFKRNEFINGDFIVIGARREYAFYVANMRTGAVVVRLWFRTSSSTASRISQLDP